MRIPAFLIVLLVLTAPSRARDLRQPFPYEAALDSLFAAGAHDSMLTLAAREVTRAEADNDTARVGRMVFQRGRARVMLGQPGAAADFERAQNLAVAARDTIGWGSALGLKGILASMSGRYDDAILLNQERLRLARLSHHRRSEAWAHLHLGYSLLQLRRLPEAREHYIEAARGFAESKRPREELTALIGRAMVDSEDQRYDDSRRAYERALVRARELGDPIQEADVINNLGEIDYTFGEIDRAARRFREAYEIKRDAGAFDMPETAVNVTMLYSLLGQYAAAESVLVDATAACERLGYDAMLPKLQFHLGELRMERGRPRHAISAFRTGLATPGSVQHRIENATGLAQALEACDSIAQAVAVLDRELAGLEPLAPSGWRADAYATWARVLRRAGEVERAEEAAGHACADALARDDARRGVMGATEMCEAYRAAGDLARALEWYEKARTLFDEAARRNTAFQWREAQRQSLVQPLLDATPVTLDWPLTIPRAEREARLFGALQGFRARTLADRISDPRRVEEASKAIGSAPLSWADEAREALRPGECLLDISVAGDRVFVFALTSDTLQLAVIDRVASDLEQKARAYSRLVASPPTEPGGSDPTQVPARRLGALLLKELAGPIGASPRLWVVADGWLAAVPFETLVCPGEEEPLGIAHEVARVPSLTLLRHARRAEPGVSQSGVLAVAPGDRELRYAHREIDRLEERVAGVERFAGAQPESLLTRMHGRAIVHVASHVWIDGERPWHSAMDIGAGREHALRASQLLTATLNPHLVVLSGCESALGRATFGDGVLGVSAAFLVAGADAIVASLWEVDDRTTASLMQEFYRGLVAGQTSGEALTAARAAIRERRPHPFFWAGFVLIGDAGVAPAVQARSPGLSPIVMIGIGLAAVAGAVWGFRRRRARIRA